MPAQRYRPPEIGDLLAVRSHDPRVPETQVVIDRVADAGAWLLLSGSWQGTDLEVVIRRVAATALQPLEK